MDDLLRNKQKQSCKALFELVNRTKSEDDRMKGAKFWCDLTLDSEKGDKHYIPAMYVTLAPLPRWLELAHPSS